MLFRSIAIVALPAGIITAGYMTELKEEVFFMIVPFLWGSSCHVRLFLCIQQDVSSISR